MAFKRTLLRAPFLLLVAALVMAAGPLPVIPEACRAMVERLAEDRINYWHPTRRDFDGEGAARPSDFHVLSYGQKELSEPGSVDQIKADMLAGSFDFAYSRYTMSGFYHRRYRTLFVTEGHHRFIASLEIAYESGDWSSFNRLVTSGVWENVDRVPPGARALPFRKSAWLPGSWRTFVRSLSPPSLSN